MSDMRNAVNWDDLFDESKPFDPEYGVGPDDVLQVGDDSVISEETYTYSYSKQMGGYVVERLRGYEEVPEYVGVVPGKKVDVVVSRKDYAKRYGLKEHQVVHDEVKIEGPADGYEVKTYIVYVR